MRLWRRLFLAILICIAYSRPASANHEPRITVPAYLGSINQFGPHAAAFDSVRGLLYQTYLGSGRVTVVRQDTLVVVRSWELPDWSNEGTVSLALSPGGDRIAVLRTSLTGADIALFSDAGAFLGMTSFGHDGRSVALAMTSTAAYIARAGLPLLQFNGTLLELGSVPSSALASLTLAGDELAYFAPEVGDQVNLVLLNTTSGSVRATAFTAPATASYVVRATSTELYIASCGGLTSVNIVTGAVVRSFGTEAIGCLTDVAISADGATAVALPFNSSGDTALVYVDLVAGTIGRSVRVAGGSGQLVAASQSGRVYVATRDYTSGLPAYSGVLDVASGELSALPYGITFAGGAYALAVGATTVSRYDRANNIWQTAAYGGTVTKTLHAPDGTVYVQIADAVARIRPGATRPDAFYAGGDDMVLNGTTLYSRDNAHIFVSDTNDTVSRVLTSLPRYQYREGMTLDARSGTLSLGWTYQQQNARSQVGLLLVNTANGATQDALSGNGSSLTFAHDPGGRRLFVVNGGDSGQTGGELHVVDLQSGAAIILPAPGMALGSPLVAMAYDSTRNLLAVADGANLAAFDGTGRQVWRTSVNSRALDVRSASWIVGGDNALTLVEPLTGRIISAAAVGYSLTDVGMVNDLVYGFDAISGASISAQRAARGLVFQVEAASLPPTSWETTPTSLIVGDAGGVIVVSSPHQGSGSRGTVPTFYSRWARPDLPVVTGAAQRSWTWGPRPWATQVEPYAEGSNGIRLVEYRDKARMELTDPTVNPAAAWYVTNGLLVQEMVSGQLQTGDRRFEPAPCPTDPARRGCASTMPVAGDGENNSSAPTYADMSGFVTGVDRSTGQRISTTLLPSEGQDRRLVVNSRPDLATDATELVEYDPTTRHNIPRVLWNYMNQRGSVYVNGRYVQQQVVDPLFAFGRPISEPYWTQARVSGETRDVLIQLFERRVLTYTPANPQEFQVEMGNVGQHYYAWRYGEKRW